MSCRVRLLMWSVPAVLAWGAVPTAVSAQTTNVVLPPVTVGVHLSIAQQVVAHGAEPRYSARRPGLTIDVNLRSHAAVFAEADAGRRGGRAVLGGLRLCSSFFYGNERDPVPGRVFAAVALGRVTWPHDVARLAVQATVGVDLLAGRTAPIAIRAESGWRVVPGAEVGAHGGRVTIGVVFGPRLR